MPRLKESLESALSSQQQIMGSQRETQTKVQRDRDRGRKRQTHRENHRKIQYEERQKYTERKPGQRRKETEIGREIEK